MSDEDFLNYCEQHSKTRSAGFTSSQLYRLFKLSGDPNGGNWGKAPKNHVENFGHCPQLIIQRVELARSFKDNAREAEE